MSGDRGGSPQISFNACSKADAKIIDTQENEPSGYSHIPKSLRSRWRDYRIKGMCISAFHRLIQCETRKTSLLYLRP